MKAIKWIIKNWSLIVVLSLSLLLINACGGGSMIGSGNSNSWSILLGPYEENAYGTGTHSDATGKPFKWQTQDGQIVQPGINVEPDAYGLGVGQDEYGRAVKPVSAW